MMIKSVTYLNCLEAAPALVGRWHKQESRLLSFDHNGSNLNTSLGQAEAWKKKTKMYLELILINNPSPQSARKMCLVFVLK